MHRKISEYIYDYLKKDNSHILCIDGARQIGKTYIIREVGTKLFENYAEINLADDFIGDKYFANVNSLDSFYLALGSVAGEKLKNRDNTLVFLDEIQVYPALFSLLKTINRDNRYKYICSGSEFGITIKRCDFIPMGSIIEKKMYPMDFEEFLLANSVGENVIHYLKDCYEKRKEVKGSIHERIMRLFKLYLLIGGMPGAVKEYFDSRNIYKVRELQNDLIRQYGDNASKYDQTNRLKIKRIYDLIPSNIENKVKRLKFKDIEGKESDRYLTYVDEFDYLLSSGIALGAKGISEPRFPLVQSSNKNLIKLYMNDVGLLTSLLYKTNTLAILNDMANVNLGAVYETVVAEELLSHDHQLFYYDRRNVGEVDFLIDNFNTLSVLSLEIKSGKDCRNARALPKLVSNGNNLIKDGYVLSNDNKICQDGKICYLPIYDIMFI